MWCNIEFCTIRYVSYQCAMEIPSNLSFLCCAVLLKSRDYTVIYTCIICLLIWSVAFPVLGFERSSCSVSRNFFMIIKYLPPITFEGIIFSSHQDKVCFIFIMSMISSFAACTKIIILSVISCFFILKSALMNTTSHAPHGIFLTHTKSGIVSMGTCWWLVTSAFPNLS